MKATPGRKRAPAGGAKLDGELGARLLAEARIGQMGLPRRGVESGSR